MPAPGGAATWSLASRHRRHRHRRRRRRRSRRVTGSAQQLNTPVRQLLCREETGHCGLQAHSLACSGGDYAWDTRTLMQGRGGLGSLYFCWTCFLSISPSSFDRFRGDPRLRFSERACFAASPCVRRYATSSNAREERKRFWRVCVTKSTVGLRFLPLR